MQTAQPGDTVHLRPDGGALQLENWPLVVGTRITVTGAPPPSNRTGDGRTESGKPETQFKGTTVIKCSAHGSGALSRH